MVAMNRPEASELAKRFATRFLLRLDSGAILGDGLHLGDQTTVGPILLPADRAFALGRLGPQHAHSLETKLQKAHKAVPGAQPLRSVSDGAVKHHLPEAPAQQPSSKRQRGEPSVGTGAGLGVTGHRQGPPSPSSHNVSSWRGRDFKDKCVEIVRQVKSGLGRDSGWFTAPVNLREVPDYLKVVEQPIDLGTIQTRLESGYYSSPKGFCEDMRRVWSNCLKYNGAASLVGKLGLKGQNIFEQAWAGSGFSDAARARRSTAGVAAPKFEPAAGVPDKRPRKQPGQQMSKSGRRQSKFKDNLARMHSTAHNANINRPMDRERKQVLAEAVQNLDDSKLEAVMALLREAGVPQSETGECELDFDVLDNSVLWELDHLILGSTAQPAGNGLAESDSDSDSE